MCESTALHPRVDGMVPRHWSQTGRVMSGSDRYLLRDMSCRKCRLLMRVWFASSLAAMSHAQCRTNALVECGKRLGVWGRQRGVDDDERQKIPKGEQVLRSVTDA